MNSCFFLSGVTSALDSTIIHSNAGDKLEVKPDNGEKLIFSKDTDRSRTYLAVRQILYQKRQIPKQTDRQIERQTDRQTERQTDRQTDRQAD